MTRNKTRRSAAVTGLVMALAQASASAQLRLAELWTDHAVVQADRPICVWGWSDAGSDIRVTLGDQDAQAAADDRGAWAVQLEARPACAQPLILRATAGDETVERGDIVIGDVWLCAGQSNMERPLSETLDADAAVRTAGDPLLRYFILSERGDREPADHVDAVWRIPDAGAIGAIPAVPVYFGQALRREVDRPVGLVVAAASGTRVEAWVAASRLAGDERFTYLFEAAKKVDDYIALRRTSPQQAGPVGELADEDDPRMMSPWLYLKRAPGVTFNGMIHPLRRTRFRAVLWFQGESNTSSHETYEFALGELIDDWRVWFDDPGLPFGIVQLMGLGRSPQHKYAGGVAAVREAQRRVRSRVDHTGLIVTFDIGDGTKLHPPDKLPVAARAAQWALAAVYDRDMPGEGPLPLDARRHGRQVRIRFESVGEGLTLKPGDAPLGFELAGDDGTFVPAPATIAGDAVVIDVPSDLTPRRVRYAWADLPQSANLANTAGLPATPFELPILKSSLPQDAGEVPGL